MESGAHLPGVRAVRALTRLHYAPGRGRPLSPAAARDLARSCGWGWHANIVGLGVGWKRVDGAVVGGAVTVTFFVRRKETKNRLPPAQRIPPEIELESAAATVVTDVVVLPGRCIAHGGLVRPLRSRAEVGHARGGRGTLGLIVRKTGTTENLVLSCSHAIARSGAIEDFGRSVEQPVGAEGRTIGTLTDDFSKLRSGTLATHDVALARVATDAEPGIAGSSIVPRTTSPKLAKEFKVGEQTVLFGAVNNGVRGRVATFASTFEIEEVPFVSGPVVFSGLVAYETRSAKGDSGGVVMSGKPGEESVVLGIHTAGRSDGKLGLFQPIGPIMTKFGLELLLP